MSKLEEKVEELYHGICIRQFLKEKLQLSSRLIKSAAIEKRILVNGEPVRMKYILNKDDNVVVELNKKNESQNIEPEKMDLDIQVSKLRVLKQSYLSEHYSLEDRILTQYPRAIQALSERILGDRKSVV